MRRGNGSCVSPLARFGATACVTLSPTFAADWATLHTQLAPHIASGAVVGIMLGDERMYHGASMANLSAVTAEIRRTWYGGLMPWLARPAVTVCWRMG